ncbi:hypothetical protein ACFSSA_12090 [Luteolibacter algae]|uniref:DUF1460 domain-containing protein n=1 Tax=Luteolibacter algae TaxID=454151 RepID=A0ABW5DAF8_9BACT
MGLSAIDEWAIVSDGGQVKPVLKILFGAILFCGFAWLGWWIWQGDGETFSVMIRGEKLPEPDPARYEVLVSELERWQQELGARYQSAATDREREAIEHDARVILELVMPEMMYCWLGTGYDFNGTAEKPGEGPVACGYFVSTVIRDAGFKVNRYKLAQQPSGNIMRTFLPKAACQLKVGADYDSYVDWLEGMRPGIYLIGLDTHVGFIINEGSGIKFIHSSGSGPYGVVAQKREKATALKVSNWRMIGSFSSDAGVIRTWLRRETVKVKN